jgi:hypothetical protein
MLLEENLEVSTSGTRQVPGQAAGDWPTWKRHDGEVLELVCRANLDLHPGTAGWHSKRFGNLGTDGAHIVYGRAWPMARTRLAICGLTGRARQGAVSVIKSRSRLCRAVIHLPLGRGAVARWSAGRGLVGGPGGW